MLHRNYHGWTPSPPDYRDLKYSAPIAVLDNMPAAVDLSRASEEAPWSPAWDQGPIGSCGPHTAGADVVFDGLKHGIRVMPSRLFIYWCTRRLMGTLSADSGVTNRALMQALLKFGWCDEKLWPYDTAQLYAQPPQVCFDQAKERKIAEYRAVPQDLSQMKACLAGGDPWWLGFSVYSNFEAAVLTGEVQMPKGSRLGGHDVLVVGYDDATQRFKFRNSYGSEWGQQGYGTIPYAYASNPGLAADFWTVVRVKAPAPPAPTPPGPFPPANDTVEIVTPGTYRLVKV